MNYQKKLEFITNNQHSDLKDFYDKSYEKLKELNTRIDRLTISLLVVVLVYFLLARTSIESFSVLFAYLLFDLLISSIHKTEMLITVKMLFPSVYVQDVEPSDFDAVKNQHSFFTRILLPFSFTTELSRLVSGKTPVGLGCFGILLALPLLSLYFLPFVLEYFMLKDTRMAIQKPSEKFLSI